MVTKGSDKHPCIYGLSAGDTIGTLLRGKAKSDVGHRQESAQKSFIALEEALNGTVVLK